MYVNVEENGSLGVRHSLVSLTGCDNHHFVAAVESVIAEHLHYEVHEMALGSVWSSLRWSLHSQTLS